VQIIFQDPFASLNPRMRVAEILDEGLAALQPDTTPGDRRQRIEAIADQVGLRREACSAGRTSSRAASASASPSPARWPSTPS
jgi:ABC-type microcin C transport system duplicated ATPase subunit YejF